MKKLMIAAAAAAMIGGAYAGACDDITPDVATSDCLVYDVKFSVKTLTAKKLTCKSCDECSESTVVYYLTDTTRTINGYLWFCEDDCWTQDDEPFICLWEKKSKTAIIPLYYYYTAAGAIAQAPVTTQFDFLGRYNKKANKVAAIWTVEDGDYWFCAAGTKGSVFEDKDAGTVTLKNISGNCVGKLPSLGATIEKKCEEPEEVAAKIAGLCDCWENWCDDGDDADILPASGTWSLKYNKSVSTGKKSMLTLVPSYALELED